MKNFIKCYCGHTTRCDCVPETLEEAKFNSYKEYWNEYHTQLVKSNFLNGFENGAKWQQEQDKKLYSEEEVLNFTQTILMQYKFGNTNIEQLDLLKETLEQFKKK